MNKKEFIDLNQDLFTELANRLPNSDIRITKTANPHLTLVGISYEKGGNIYEVYEMYNDGDVAEWKYKGVGQLG